MSIQIISDTLFLLIPFLLSTKNRQAFKVQIALPPKNGSISPTKWCKAQMCKLLEMVEKASFCFTNIYTESLLYNLGCNSCANVPATVLWSISTKNCVPKKAS